MRTNIILDAKLIARAMKKARATTMRETIDIALSEYVSKPDYDHTSPDPHWRCNG